MTTPAFCCRKSDLTTQHGSHHRITFTDGELEQLYTAVRAYYGDPTAPPLNREDPTITADLHRAACTLYNALRENIRSRL